MAEGAPRATRRSGRWRKLLRGLHRDAGYLAVGLTFVYAVSGIAVNHIGQWDPNFVQVATTHPLDFSLPRSDLEAGREVGRRLGIEGEPTDVYRASETLLDVTFPAVVAHVDTQAGEILVEGQRPRPLLRVANWLHLNRGKEAWTAVADAYAVLLILLATSGMFMLAGRKGLLGRGGLLVLAGAAVPVVYVVTSGGPGG